MDITGSAVETIGRAALITALTRDGLEVARPERDVGTDLIAFLTEPGAPFIAVPIQLKAASRRSFSIDRKYATTESLLMTFVWNLSGPEEPELYALTYADSLAIAERFGWTASKSWTVKGRWNVTSPGHALRAALEPHRMTSGRWRAAIVTAWSSSSRPSAPPRDHEIVGTRTHPPVSIEDAIAEEERHPADPDDPWFGEPPPVPLADLLAARGTASTLVVRSHTEGLGPKSLFGKVIGISDVMVRRYGRLRPYPAMQVQTCQRHVVIPLDLIEGLHEGDVRDELGLADPFDFEALTPGDDFTGTDYVERYPQP